MADQERISQLQAKMEDLLKRQNDLSNDISDLRREMGRMKTSEKAVDRKPEDLAALPLGWEETVDEKSGMPYFYNRNTGESTWTRPVEEKEQSKPEHGYKKEEGFTRTPEPSVPKTSRRRVGPKVSSDFEKFIGENLISKIGIAILVIGVGIGVKYSIDNDLISPLTRVVLGYLLGAGLLGIGMKLKLKYEKFSAVLVSGAMAIMYYMTFAAYSFYDLFPQFFAFSLMVAFTAFTVLAAIKYNQQVIAHIGLVGAYAVPYLLSDGSGKVAVLFTYMAIINIGILVIAFKKYWKALYYVSFALTWLIFATWYVDRSDAQFVLSLSFLAIFFATFYAAFLGYKLLRKEQFKIIDVVMTMANSFIFYGLGYAILDDHDTGKQLLGLFTLINAVGHFVVAVIIYRQRSADKDLLNLVSGMVLVFITIAIPVQLDGDWVTLMWAGEAALLFWIGRTKQVGFYEKLSYPLMLIAFFSIVQDWSEAYYLGTWSTARQLESIHLYTGDRTPITTILNPHFLTSVLFIAAFGWIAWLDRRAKYPSTLAANNTGRSLVSFCVPAILTISVYAAFLLEISNYWNLRFISSIIQLDGQTLEEYGYSTIINRDQLRFRTVWILNYTLLFVGLLAFLNIAKLKSRPLGRVNLGLILITLFGFLTMGLYELSELRVSYLEQAQAAYYYTGVFNVGIRYFSLALVAMVLVTSYRYVRTAFIGSGLKVVFDLVLHISILWIVSSELLNWMDIAGTAGSYKLGLSILWGAYALLLIAFGIWKKKKYLRISAIVLFGATLVKLFFYDIGHLDTISKTIVFVVLGLLLLTVSFLYTKYKHIISTDDED